MHHGVPRRRQLHDDFLHLLARLELHDRAGLDGKLLARVAWDASNPRFAMADFEDAEVPQLDSLAAAQAFDNAIECFLHDVGDLPLHQPCFFADARH